MPDIQLVSESIDYLSDLQFPVCAWRGLADVLFLAADGTEVDYPCIVDTGAPFSVIPYSLWHDRLIPWSSHGAQLFRAGTLDSGALRWQGVPCTLGSTTVRLFDQNQDITAGPLVLIGKFAGAPQPKRQLERIALLGLNFLTDNYLHLRFDGAAGHLVGTIDVP